MNLDYRDFYIKYKDLPGFNNLQLVEDDAIAVIIQKYLMIIYTSKGEVMGDPDFGANLEYLLFSTMVDSSWVEYDIRQQISKYIPEIGSMSYSLKIVFAQDDLNFYDIMYIYFQIADYEIYNSISNYNVTNKQIN